MSPEGRMRLAALVRATGSRPASRRHLETPPGAANDRASRIGNPRLARPASRHAGTLRGVLAPRDSG